MIILLTIVGNINLKTNYSPKKVNLTCLIRSNLESHQNFTGSYIKKRCNSMEYVYLKERASFVVNKIS